MPEGYKPSEEEIQKAENSMSERQEDYSIIREKLMSRAESLGVSRKAFMNAELKEDERGRYLIINGHSIRTENRVKVFVDDKPIMDRDDRIRLSALVDIFIYMSYFGRDTSREAAYYAAGFHDDDGLNVPPEVAAAIKDIFSEDKGEN